MLKENFLNCSKTRKKLCFKNNKLLKILKQLCYLLNEISCNSHGIEAGEIVMAEILG